MSVTLINKGEVGKYSLRMTITAAEGGRDFCHVTLRATIIDKDGEHDLGETTLNLGDSYQFDMTPVEAVPPERNRLH